MSSCYLPQSSFDYLCALGEMEPTQLLRLTACAKEMKESFLECNLQFCPPLVHEADHSQLPLLALIKYLVLRIWPLIALEIRIAF